MQKSVKINEDTYKILVKIKEELRIPIVSSIDLAVEKYAHEKGVK